MRKDELVHALRQHEEVTLAGHRLSAERWALEMFAKALDRLLSKDDTVFSGLIERAEPPSWLLLISSGVLSLTATSEEVPGGSDYIVKTTLYPHSAIANVSVIIEDTARGGKSDTSLKTARLSFQVGSSTVEVKSDTAVNAARLLTFAQHLLLACGTR